MTPIRLSILAAALSLAASAGQADNIWRTTGIPTGPATYAAGMTSRPVPVRIPPQQSLPQPVALAMAPDFNGWRGGAGPGASGGGIPFLCGAGSFSFGGNGFGFNFGF